MNFISRFKHRFIVRGKAVCRLHDLLDGHDEERGDDYFLMEKLHKRFKKYDKAYYKICDHTGSIGHSYTYYLYMLYSSLINSDFTEILTVEKIRKDLILGCEIVLQGMLKSQDYVSFTEQDINTCRSIKALTHTAFPDVSAADYLTA